jgi:hypothetical protein
MRVSHHLDETVEGTRSDASTRTRCGVWRGAHSTRHAGNGHRVRADDCLSPDPCVPWKFDWTHPSEREHGLARSEGLISPTD